LIRFQGHALEMQLVSVSADIKRGRDKSMESGKHIHQKLKDIEHQITSMSEFQNRGAEELANFLSMFNRSRYRDSPHFGQRNYVNNSGIPTHRESNILPAEEVSSTESPNRPITHQSNAKRRNPASVGTKSTLAYHFTFEQRVVNCENSCSCNCHSRKWSFNARLGTSTLFKHIFGSLLFGYSNSPTPRVACNTNTCSLALHGSKISIRYSFPTWFTNRVIFSMFSTYANHHPNFALRIVRRIPYAPGNIFSKINSRDFSGAIELLQRGDATVNDIETSHGNSVLGAALRRPAPGPGLIRFLEYLLRRQVNPYLANDEGESAWHFAARLMFPKTPTSIVPAELQLQLHRLFPYPDWEVFQFSHIHMVVVGLRPINLSKALENPKYLSQVSAKDSLGQTPLGLAATLGDPEAVEALLLAGADPNTHSNPTTFHPLRKAVRARNARCVELLLMASANPFSLDRRGASALHTAAASCDDLAIIRPLLLTGLRLDGRNTHDCTPLSFTPLKDSSNVAHFLLSQGADINSIDKDGDTPLTESIRLNAHSCLELFLRKGADYHTVNKIGWTVLHFAATHADITTLKILASHYLSGLDTEAQDVNGKTPMKCLAERHYVSRQIMDAFGILLQSVSREKPPPKLTKAAKVSLVIQKADIWHISAKRDTALNWNSLMFSKSWVAFDKGLWLDILIILLFIGASLVTIFNLHNFILARR
jgi:ankyrin repeat protein